MHKKLRQGATQGAKFSRGLQRARKIAAFLTFSHVSSHTAQIEQTLRRGLLYPLNYGGVYHHIILIYVGEDVKERNFAKLTFKFVDTLMA